MDLERAAVCFRRAFTQLSRFSPPSSRVMALVALLRSSTSQDGRGPLSVPALPLDIGAGVGGHYLLSSEDPVCLKGIPLSQPVF